MAIYLKKFETQAAYEAAESGLILPNVSLTVDNNTVHYNPSTPPTPSHEYVDLGLPSGTKWATMNVGANSITDYGNYFKYGSGADECDESYSFYEGTENPLAASADTASIIWGEQWHIPTNAQFEELIANTTYEWVTDYQGSGINGGTFTANGQTIFLPAGGDYIGGGQDNVEGEVGCYCSSTPQNYDRYYFVWFGEYGRDTSVNTRYICLSVRPVMDA